MSSVFQSKLVFISRFNPIALFGCLYYSHLLSFNYTGNFASWFVFIFNLLHFYYLITLYNILFFFFPLFCYFIHLRSIICSLETKLNCFALPTAPQRVRRRLLFVTLCPSRFKILPLLLSRDTVRLIRARMMSLIRDNSLLSSFQRGKAKVVSGDEGLNDFVQDFAGHFYASVGKKGFTSISVSDM